MNIHQQHGTRKFKAPFEGVIPTLDRRYNETKSQGMRDFYELYMSYSPCETCHGARLKKESLAVKVGDKNINELTDMSIDKIKDFLNRLELNSKDSIIADQILKELNINFYEAKGEAAFYGPKLDIQFKNVHGKEDTIITIQIDFSLAERFDMVYIDSDGKKKHPMIIHRSSIGCYERTIAMLIEKYTGALPVWLSPVQVRVLPISDKFNNYGEKVTNELKKLGIRAECDYRYEKIGYKIRQGQLEKIPYLLIVE